MRATAWSWLRTTVCCALGLATLGAEARAEDRDPLNEVEDRGLAQVEPAASFERPAVVLAGGTVLTAAGQRHEPGYVVLVDGRITAVGAGAPPEVEGARVLDVTGRFVTPGLIDTHSHLGVYPAPHAHAHSDGNEASAPTTAGVWAEHSLWPQDPGLQRAIAGGVTALQVLPGSANLIGGRGVIVQVVPARGARAMRFPGAPETVKMACGENPKRVYGHHKNTAPSTRMGNLRGQRQAFLDAVATLREWEEYDAELTAWREAEASGKRRRKDPPAERPTPPDRDLDEETLAGVLTGRVLPQIHCYRADDLLAMVAVADEFGFAIRSFHHAVEAYKVRDVLAERGISASIWADWWGFKMEAYDGILENAAMLTDAGARAVIHSDSAIGIQRLNQEAAKAWYAGLHAGFEVSEDQALRWITANAAWTLGIDDQTGTLEVGKRGDVVVWDAYPFSVYAKPQWVFVDGALRYDRARPEVWSDFELGQEVRR